MVRQSRCAEHWSCQPSRTFPVLGMQNQEEWSLQVRRDRTAGALGCNNLLAEFGHSAKFSACAMVSGNVFLSYLSRSIWDPQISNLTSTATELLCWLLSVLLTALFHHPILNLSKYPLRWWKSHGRTILKILSEYTGRCFPRINLFPNCLELLPDLIYVPTFARDKWMLPASHTKKTNERERVWKWTEPFSHYKCVFRTFLMSPVKPSQNYDHKSLVPHLSPCHV